MASVVARICLSNGAQVVRMKSLLISLKDEQILEISEVHGWWELELDVVNDKTRGTLSVRRSILKLHSGAGSTPPGLRTLLSSCLPSPVPCLWVLSEDASVSLPPPCSLGPRSCLKAEQMPHRLWTPWGSVLCLLSVYPSLAHSPVVSGQFCGFYHVSHAPPAWYPQWGAYRS